MSRGCREDYCGCGTAAPDIGEKDEGPLEVVAKGGKHSTVEGGFGAIEWLDIERPLQDGSRCQEASMSLEYCLLRKWL